MMSVGRLGLTVLACTAASAGGLVLAGAPALGAVTHDYVSQITEVPAKGPHGESVSLPGPVKELNSMTVDEEHLWIAEHAEQSDMVGTSSSRVDGSRVDEFNASTNAFMVQLPQVSGLGDFEYGVSVGHTTGEGAVYVGARESASGQFVVAVFDEATGAWQATWRGPPAGLFKASQEGEFDVAADKSSNLTDSASGDVYVLDDSRSGSVVDVFEPEAGGKEKYITQITGPSASEPFLAGFISEEPKYLAVDDENGDLLVSGQQWIDIFKPVEGMPGQYEFLRTITGPPPDDSFGSSGIRDIAFDSNGEIYAAEPYNGAAGGFIYEFSSSGVYLGRTDGSGTPEGTFGEPGPYEGLAVDPVSHRLFAALHHQNKEPEDVVDVFGPDIVLPDVTTTPATDVKGTGEGTVDATLNGSVDPDGEGPATCKFVWGTSEAAMEHTTECETTVPESTGPVAVRASLSGLEPDVIYYFRLQATNAKGANPGEGWQDQAFTTPGPGMHGESVAEVSAESVTLQATLSPNGAPTTYYFQYGTSAAYGHDAPLLGGEAPHGLAIGSGQVDVQVGQHVQALSADTVYHYRVVALSELVSGQLQRFIGPDQTFTTQTVGGELQLLDGRQWQMVSPPAKDGALIEGIGALAVSQASSSGDAVTYFTPFVASEQDPRGSSNGGQVLSTRGPEGWSSRDIATPHNEPTGLPNQGEYLFFSEDFSRALVEPPGSFAPLQACSSSGCVGESFPEASEWTPYVRNNSTCASEVSSCYEPLLTGAEGYADVPSGTKFDRTYHEKEFMGASPDLAHAVLNSTAQLTSTTTASHEELYEWSAGGPASERLRLVSVLPVGEGGGPVPSGEGEGLYLGGAEEPFATGWRAISNDGSRIFFTVGETQEGTRRLYMRDTAKEETVRLDVEQPGGPGGESPSATFLAASADGSRVFFRDRQRLTAQSGENGNGPDASYGAGNDLYECQIVEESGKDACKLTDLTPEDSGGSAEVQNILPGTSEDGSYVYFVANGVLAPGAVQGACRYYAPAGANVTCNLYVYHAGKITFIATLAYADEADWGGTDVTSHTIGNLTARVSPNGRYITFMSDRSLTGYDNRDAVTGRPDEEVYEYDAVTEKLVCASCSPTGARPVGVEVGEFQYGNLADIAKGGGVGDYNSEAGIAANVPTGDWLGSYGVSLYQPRYLSDSGLLFFNSSDALVPQDVNGQEDVYEYEPARAGSCATDSLTYSERTGGCVDLISGGTSGQESGFLDASETGGDVFFITTAKLASADYDSARDVYDAHECTVLEPCTTPAVAPPPCSSDEGCKPAQSVQPSLFGAPSSQTFSGTGNLVQPVSKSAVERKSLTRAQKLTAALKVCKKKRKRRTVCERQARRRYRTKVFGASRAHKVNASKRGGR
jgi:hypothetical protein